MTFWTYKIFGEFKNGHEFATKEEAQEYAEKQYADYCEDNFITNGEEEILLIEFEYDYYGDIRILQSIESGVEFEECRSQYDEHNVMWNVV